MNKRTGLIERLRDAYTQWNHSSDGLPEGAGVALEAENERLRNSLNTDSQHFTILCVRAEVEMLRARVVELEADAARWRYFVRHKTFWRSSQCIQYGGEVGALRPGGPGDYELKKLSFDADIDEARAALAKEGG